MARRASVRYYASRSAYGCTYRGRQRILAKGPDDFPDGPTYTAAVQAFLDLTSLSNATVDPVGNPVRVVAEQYITFLERNTKRKPATIAIKKKWLKRFVKAYGDTRVATLTHIHVYDFCAEQGWGDGTVRILLLSLQSCFNWGVKSGLLASNPVKGIETPAPRSRGREIVLTAEEHTTILNTVSNRAADVFIALENSGARPGEIVGARGQDLDAARGAIVYYADVRRKEGELSHKTGSKGRDRVIYFTGECLAMVRRLAIAAGPNGHIFRPRNCSNTRGQWTQSDLYNRLQPARETLGRAISLYSWRHTFAYNMLAAGMDIETLAVLMGTSAAMIREHYGHIADDTDRLRAKLEQARGITPAGNE